MSSSPAAAAAANAQIDHDGPSLFYRLFLSYYGNLSIQLQPLRWQQPRTALNFALNLTLVSVTYYSIFWQTNVVGQHDGQMEEIFERKPLFGLVYKLGMQYVFQAAFILNTLYFTALSLAGNDFIHLLATFKDMNPFESSASKSRQAFAIVIAAHHAVFIMTLTALFLSLEWSSASALLKNVATYLLLYMLNTNANIVFILIHYYKCATLHSLRSIRARLQRNRLQVRQVQRQIAQLAAVSSQLNRVLALPLAISIVPYTFEIIISLACLWIESAQSAAHAYLLQFVLHAAILAHTEAGIRAELKRLELLLKGYQERAVFRTSFTLFSKQMTTFGSYRRSESHESAQIRAHQLINIYTPCFRLTLLGMCRVDWNFLFQMILFILNYVVLVSQTSM